MNRHFQSNFNTITNILFLFVLVFGGFVWADTNGVWHRAEDIIPGIFGDDEIVGNFIFVNDVVFNGTLKEGLIYEIDINGTTKLNDLRSSDFNTNLANINGDLTIDNSLILKGITCTVNEKLTSDATGNVKCVVDDNTDADYIIGNEYPLAGTGISVNGRTVGVDSTIATKTYVDSKTSGLSLTYTSYIVKDWTISSATTHNLGTHEMCFLRGYQMDGRESSGHCYAYNSNSIWYGLSSVGRGSGGPLTCTFTCIN